MWHQGPHSLQLCLHVRVWSLIKNAPHFPPQRALVFAWERPGGCALNEALVRCYSQYLRWTPRLPASHFHLFYSCLVHSQFWFYNSWGGWGAWGWWQGAAAGLPATDTLISPALLHGLVAQKLGGVFPTLSCLCNLLVRDTLLNIFLSNCNDFSGLILDLLCMLPQFKI